jgi:L-ascorbate metabolism protein UlaG (beta-lactamase superfamily)
LADVKITKYTHACVRVEHDGGVLVIDPGEWSEPRALAGADAVLVTHEHTDHIDVLRLAALGVPVYAPADADVHGVQITPVRSGEEFTAAGLRVRAVGGRHATIYDGEPDCANLGYLVQDELYHPGDSVHVPAEPVQTLLVPAHGSWVKTSEAIDFIRAVNPRRAFPIHDGQLNDRGLAGVNAWLGEEGGTDYRWLAPGETA